MATKFVPLDSKSTPPPVSNQKSPIYKVHGHFAKRPFNVVNSCIDYYTREGEIVLDPFSGFGVTGIEALRLKRKAVVMDLNPVSVFITKSILETVSSKRLDDLNDVFAELKNKISEEMFSLYKTKCAVCGRKSTIRATIYNSENDADDPRERVWKPISITYDCDKHRRRKKKPDREDIELIRQIEEAPLEHWYPNMHLVYNSRKSVYKGMKVEDIYTRRNLIALSILREEIWDLPKDEIRNMLIFAFSGILRSASMMVHEGGGGW